ncbi:UDP-glucuronosyltransferase [Clostridia bacterium]|nr:UDP-glucuronosyltransferase [Clostridia bacterium]
MKVLILSVTAGNGHNATGRALRDYFTSVSVESEVFDTYQHIAPILSRTIENGYDVSIKNMKGIYGGMYTRLENRREEKDYDKNSVMRAFHSFVSGKLYNFIEKYSPDAVICTHPLPAMLMDILKRNGSLSIPITSILTDFAFHPYWEEARFTDYLVTATELLNLKAFKKGFKRSQLLPFGIPINPKFAKSENKQKVRARLGLASNMFTVLLMGGGVGYGNMYNTMKQIDGLNIECQIIVVCGRNEKAKKQIDEGAHKKKVLCYGFVDNVDQLMDASDCIVTKPGGLTSSEALAKNLPVIVVNPIPGQEERNTEFLLNNGVAMQVTESTPLDDVIFQLFFFPEKIELMKKNIALLRHPNSTKDICEFIIDDIKNRSKQAEFLREPNKADTEDIIQ